MNLFFILPEQLFLFRMKNSDCGLIYGRTEDITSCLAAEPAFLHLQPRISEQSLPILEQTFPFVD